MHVGNVRLDRSKGIELLIRARCLIDGSKGIELHIRARSEKDTQESSTNFNQNSSYAKQYFCQKVKYLDSFVFK